MSCRLAVNMAKRAAAGAMSVSAWSEEETDSPSHATDRTLIAQRNSQHSSAGAMGLGRVTAIAFSVFAVLSFASYAAYAHQWSELSALRHLGKASLANDLNG
jgi:hypothetical protein